MFRYRRTGAGKRIGFYPYYRRPYVWRRGPASRAYASARSSKTGTKTETYNGQVNGYVTFTVPANSYRSDVHVFLPYLGALDANAIIRDTLPFHGGALNDKIFRLKCSQYDQLRLVSMKVKLSGTSYTTSTLPVKILSVVDRKSELSESEVSTSDPRMTAQEIEDNPGVIVSDYNGQRSYPITRFCSARDIQERSTYIDSTIKYSDDESNPMYVMSNLDWDNDNFEFAPAFFVALKVATTGASPLTITFSYTVEYNFMFRNPKNNIESFVAAEVQAPTSKEMREKLLKNLLRAEYNTQMKLIKDKAEQDSNKEEQKMEE